MGHTRPLYIRPHSGKGRCMNNPTTERLGDFLMKRRAQVSPESVGLPAGGRGRRVPGLRREEVALLAAISPDYYMRL